MNQVFTSQCEHFGISFASVLLHPHTSSCGLEVCVGRGQYCCHSPDLESCLHFFLWCNNIPARGVAVFEAQPAHDVRGAPEAGQDLTVVSRPLWYIGLSYHRDKSQGRSCPGILAIPNFGHMPEEAWRNLTIPAGTRQGPQQQLKMEGRNSCCCCFHWCWLCV